MYFFWSVQILLCRGDWVTRLLKEAGISRLLCLADLLALLPGHLSARLPGHLPALLPWDLPALLLGHLGAHLPGHLLLLRHLLGNLLGHIT